MEAIMKVKTTKVNAGDGLALFSYPNDENGALDLLCAATDTVVIEPHEKFAVPMGLTIDVPDGHEAKITLHEDFLAKKDVTLSTVGATFGPEFTDEILVTVISQIDEPIYILRGVPVAQLKITPVAAKTPAPTTTKAKTEDENPKAS
jgi:dUTP pyrophosphatase